MLYSYFFTLDELIEDQPLPFGFTSLFSIISDTLWNMAEASWYVED
jgi:hypothetical protein